jgi:hypothetical protein
MYFLCGLRINHQPHAELVGALGELAQGSFPVPFFVVSLALIGVFLAFGQHGVNQSGQLVCRRRHGFGLVHAGAQPPEVRAQR